MSRGVRESDWKAFRELRNIALERLCARILGEVRTITRNETYGNHARYKQLWDLLRERDYDVARAFDDPRRSRMLLQLAAIHQLGLIEEDEFSRFHPETRRSVESLVQER